MKIPCRGNTLDARALVVVHPNLKIRVPRHQAAPLLVVVSQDTTRSYGGRSRCAVLRCNTMCAAVPDLPKGDHSRHLLLKNIYTMELVRDGARWVIERMVIENVWYTGDPTVLFPNARR